VTSTWYRIAFGAHYPVIYAHRDEDEAARCLAMLPGLAPFGVGGRTRILDLGCGDGRHLARLSEKGLEAVGMDLSMDLLRRAAGRAAGAGPLRLVRGDMRRLPFRPGGFTAVMSLFTAFGYFSSRDENLQVVKEISRCLTVGGHWFLDYLDGDAVRTELAAGRTRDRVRTAGPFTVVEARSLAPGGERVTKTIRLRPLAGMERESEALGIGPGGMEYVESVALFTLDELDELAREAGLVRVAAAGGYGGEPLAGGDRWILAFQNSSDGGDRPW